MSKITLKKTVALLTCVVSLIGVSACGNLVPQPKQSSSLDSTAPAVTLEQEENIEKKILDVITKADNAKDPSLLSTRVDGPELQIRSSQLTVLKDTNQPNPNMDIPSGIRQVILPLNTEWPRNIFVITQAAQDQQAERLLVLTQNSAHDNYKFWGLVRLFSGVTLPKFPIQTIGAKSGSLDDTGLVATPREALAMYANVLENGSSSVDASKVTSGQFIQQLSNLTNAVQQAVSANQGWQKQVFTPDYQTAKIVRASNGGDLVVAQINSVWTRYAGKGHQSEPATDAEKALFGKATPTSTMKVTYVNVVALYIPPTSEGAKIEAVGAERQPISVQAIPDNK